MPLPAYVWLAYGAAALFLVLACPVSGQALSGYSLTAYAAALGLALGPQLLGHTAYNWSLRYVSPTFVAVVTLGEPVGSSFFAWLLFGEGLAFWQGVGFGLLLAGDLSPPAASGPDQLPAGVSWRRVCSRMS